MSRSDRFLDALARGRAGEEMVFNWLKTRGWGVVPSYDYSGAGGDKAPKLVFAKRRYAIPDGDVCRGGSRAWIEIKTYRHAPMNRRLGARVHGAKARLIADYRRVEEETATPVYLAVLEVRSGELLIARLATLEMFPCQCSSCTRGNPGGCRAPQKRLLYWLRSDMKIAAHFDVEEMRPLREMWAIGEGVPA